MSHDSAAEPERVTIPILRKWAGEGRRLVMVTAYDAPTALIADPVVDMLLVGDSVGNVCLGFETTLQVSMAMMEHHLDAVMRTRPRSLVVVDMPYLSFHLGVAETLRNAGGFMRRGAAGVKIEGGAKRLEVVRALLDAEIPVMAHLGLTPQSVNIMGGYRVQGRGAVDAVELLEDAHSMQEAGCFSVLLEGVPAELAARVTETLDIPTIGIGAGAQCSGQVLVLHDVLGLLRGHKAKFVRTYVDGFGVLQDALGKWSNDVREGSYPSAGESYPLPEEAREAVASWSPSAGRGR